MPAAMLIGKKVGMTRIYDADGKQVPVTVIEAGPCFVSQVKTTDNDGYDAIQLGFQDLKARNSTMQLIGHDGKAGISPKRIHREVRLKAEDVGTYELGQELKVDLFEAVKFVDVIGTSKGKGTQGVMKRFHYKGLCASHGTERKHRSPGSQGGRATNRGFSGRPKKGGGGPGRMGNETVTVRSLDVIGQDKSKNLLLIKGAVPGANGGILVIREATRLYKSKAEKAKAS